MNAPFFSKSVVTVGTFDGVHRGHIALLDYLKEQAHALGARPVVITFDRHPLQLVAPQRAPGMLMTPDERDRLIRAEGVELFRIPFDERLRSLTAAEWMAEMRQRFHAVTIVMGYDHTFGSDGLKMNLSDYRQIGEKLGINILRGPEIEGVSSSAIRHLIAEGDVEGAAKLLGRRWSLTGRVVPGKQLGRQLGFPTANIALDPSIIRPKHGVYAGTVTMPDTSVARRGELEMPAVINVGVRPSVDKDGAESIEVHIPDWTGNLYGMYLTVTLDRRLRDEQHFPTLDALRAAIATDILNCKN